MFVFGIKMQQRTLAIKIQNKVLHSWIHLIFNKHNNAANNWKYVDWFALLPIGLINDKAHLGRFIGHYIAEIGKFGQPTWRQSRLDT